MSSFASRVPVSDVIAVYDSEVPAERAIMALGRAGFDMEKLSVIGKRYRAEERALGFYCTGDRIAAQGRPGGFWDTVWGQLPGPAVSDVPQVGLVAAAGPSGLALIAARRHATQSGASELVEALMSLGMAKALAMQYEADVKANRFLLLVHGSATDAAKARSQLTRAVPQAAATAAFRGPFAVYATAGRRGQND